PPAASSAPNHCPRTRAGARRRKRTARCSPRRCRAAAFGLTTRNGGTSRSSMSRSRIRISIFRSDDCSRAGDGCGGSYCAQRHGECGKQSTLPEESKREERKGAVAAEPSKRLEVGRPEMFRGL